MSKINRWTAQRQVTLRRGQRGFGFTLAGQYPSTLNNVHPGGVAYQAGLQVGDRLLAVGNRDVSQLRHTSVVGMLADMGDVLTLTVESNICAHQQEDHNQTESSVDSDSQVWRQHRERVESRIVAGSSMRRRQAGQTAKNSFPVLSEWPSANLDEPRGPKSRAAAGRSKRRGGNGSAGAGRSGATRGAKGRRSERRVGSSLWQLSTAPVKSDRNTLSSVRERKSAKNRMNRSASEADVQIAKQPSDSLIAHVASDSSDEERQSLSSSCTSSSPGSIPGFQMGNNPENVLLFQAVLVYIGAVPVPHLNLARRHVIRCAVQSLRAQRAKARTVQMQIFPDQIVVTNSRGSVTQRFATSSIAYAGACAENKQFLGICTTVMDDSRPNSLDDSPNSVDGTAICHVFAADPQLHLHSFHYQYAKKFNIRCSRDPEHGFCLEFPYISSPVLYALTWATRGQPRRLQTTDGGRMKRSSVGYASSNSDSGIGGRESANEWPERKAPHGVLKKCASTATGSPLRVTFEEQEPTTTPSRPNLLDVKADVHVQDQDSDDHRSVSAKVSLLQQPVPPIRLQRSLDEASSRDDANLSDLDKPRKLSISQPDLNSLSRKQQLKHSDPMLSQQDVETALRNPKTRKPFEDFLDQQFCGENLRFWLAIESYRLAPSAERPKLGRQIYEQHFSENCMEPVNVDSGTINAITQAVNGDDFGPTIFDSAQYQIFHLLKYDVWPRFLQWQSKFASLQPRSTTLSSTDSGTSAEHRDDKCKDAKRKTPFLSWKPKFSRKKKDTVPMQSQSQDKELMSEDSPHVSSVGTKRKQAWKTGKQHSVPSEFYHNVKPSTSSKPDVVPEAEPQQAHSPQMHGRTCTVILPTGQRKLMPVSQEMTVRQWLQSFAEEWGLNALATQVIDTKTSRVIDHAKSVPGLQDMEVRLDASVMVTVELATATDPNVRKQLLIKARPDSMAGTVLRTVLEGYGLELDKMVVCIDGTNEVLPSSSPIHKADRRRLLVLTQQQFQEWVHSDRFTASCPTSPIGAAMPGSFNDNSPPSPSKFTELASTAGVSVAELASSSGSTLGTPKIESQRSSSWQAKGDGSNTSGPLSGMLKFVRKSSHGNGQEQQQQQQPQATTSAQLQSGSSEVLGSMRRKSLGLIKTAMGGGGGKNGPVKEGNKRQSCANPQEFREQQQQDKAFGEIWNRASANRLDDQRGVGLASRIEMPDFLNPTSGSDGDVSGIIPSNEEAEALFSGGHNVSLVQVGQEAKKPSPHPTGKQGALRCRLPNQLAYAKPPLYTSSVGSVQQTQDSSPSSPGWCTDYV